MEPPLAHAGRNALLIQHVGDESGAFAIIPKAQDFLDHAALLRVHDELAVKPVVSVREDRGPHLLGPRCFLLRTFDRPSKCVATGCEGLADGRFRETRFRFYFA